ncbi:MAG: acylphosphatase [Nitrososphaerales archaeon]
MIRAEIIVRGSVQRVGYRDLVQDEARRLGVRGYVENLRDGSVKILCEAEEEVVKEFMKAIDVKEDLLKVESIEVTKTSPPTGEYQYFEVKYGPLEEELSERMVAAIKYAKGMWSDIKGMREDIKEMKGDIKEMKGDIKEMKGDIKEMKGDIKEMKGDIKTVLKKQDETIFEIRALRDDLRSYIDRRFERLEAEIRAIKEKIGLM